MKAPILGTRSTAWADEVACAAAAADLAAAIARPVAARAGDERGATIELHGPLGAGKTTFARHLLHALGVQGTVRSPTYTLMEPYQAGDLAISHFDFYRFDDPQEWEDAGFRDVFATAGLRLVEWPEKAAGLLPLADLVISIEPRTDAAPAPDGADHAVRDVRAVAHSELGAEWLAHAPSGEGE